MSPSVAVVRSRALTAARAIEVTVEVHLANGLPCFAIVGLAATEVRESRDRVRAAIQNSRFEFPTRRITVNLAPADLPKSAGHFDLPIALGILIASGQLPPDCARDAEFAAELSLTGELRSMHGAFAIACGIAQDKTRPTPKLFVPAANAREAALVEGVGVYGAPDLAALCAHLAQHPEQSLMQATPLKPMPIGADPSLDRSNEHLAQTEVIADMSDVIGQMSARRALEVAAAGAHHMLMVGPPGSGKSMLAARLPGILPPMTDDEALASAALLSASRHGFHPSNWRCRPFRAPHHSATAASLVGGGNPPQPGEISLAHHGVLFLDEWPEFERRALEMLREPLETGHVTISRAARHADYPASCQLIAAMNPCPCGWLGDASGRCRCGSEAIDRYQRRLSGPLLDRIDVVVHVPALVPAELTGRHAATPESSRAIRERVTAAHRRQIERQGVPNRMLSARQIRDVCRLDTASEHLLERAASRRAWSARAHFRTLRVARTIADLSGEVQPTVDHLAEAIQYRRSIRSE
ncbi:YifB family Mg chelatase-like AAA ATPase [Pararobbsia silviterrae]|uniref:ATP-binding protein n=1 Tax=Pararobbsia silviterrae TaxID=1792498 RepID=A0A494YAL2_9BURK|nr:YifB family Mg chelatase-like AAA ATPase [Pararobbsia silviterrae]RKP58780.1 ATP-binding protein [Pararobbsia silviterrae]